MEQCCTSGSSCPSRFIVKPLILIGALNWGLVGLGMFLGKDLNVVKMLLGTWPTVEAVVYLLVGLAAVYKLARMCCLGCCQAKK